MQYSRNENSLSCLRTLLYMYSVYTHLALSSYSAYVSMLRKTTSHAQDYMREHIVEDTCNVTDNPDIYIIGVTLLLLSQAIQMQRWFLVPWIIMIQGKPKTGVVRITLCYPFFWIIYSYIIMHIFRLKFLVKNIKFNYGSFFCSSFSVIIFKLIMISIFSIIIPILLHHRIYIYRIYIYIYDNQRVT